MKPTLLKGWRFAGTALLSMTLLLTSACGNDKGAVSDDGTVQAAAPKGSVTLVIGAYSIAKDAFAELLPAFAKQWKAKTGQTVTFQESYEASGTQARAIAGGFEADVTVLALENDMDKVQKAGLITSDWRKQFGDNGMVTRSLAVIGTRKGNPKDIHDWDDLTRKGIKVLYPNPQTSGGAQWDINAMYGAGLKESEAKTGKKDPAFAKEFLKQIHRNVESLDKSGTASMAAFEYGFGDAIVTYESELKARIDQGVAYEEVIPNSTIQIENPAAIIDKNVDKHGTRKVAEALLTYLHSEDGQRTFAKYGFRPVNASVMAELKDEYVTPPDLFDIQYLGGWDEVRKTLYSAKGVWYQVLAGT